MQTSANAYQKAEEILAYIKLNPDSHMQQIADAVDMLKATTHILVQKMVHANVLIYTTRKHRGGKRYFYQATGKRIPPSIPIHKVKIGQAVSQSNIEPLPTEEFAALPSFIRAITPAIPHERGASIVVYGHTPDQHKLQSAIIRKERSKAQRGVKYTGEARL